MNPSESLENLARFFAIAACALFISSIAQAQTCPGTTPTGMTCIAAGANTNITADSVCAKVTNSHPSGKAIMVAHATAAEWLSFRNNLPTGVTTAACAATCSASAQTITTSGAGSVTVPASCATVTIEAWGGGGPGAMGTETFDGILSGPGGGSGGYTRKVVTVTPGTSVSYAIGGAMGDTTVSGMTAGGGKAGVAPGTFDYEGQMIPAGPGAGGTAAGGTTNTPGNPGLDGNAPGVLSNCTTSVSGGAGGSAPSGGAGGAPGPVGGNGQPGNAPGGGGSGGGVACTSGSVSNYGLAGAGANGGVKFTWSN